VAQNSRILLVIGVPFIFAAKLDTISANLTTEECFTPFANWESGKETSTNNGSIVRDAFRWAPFNTSVRPVMMARRMPLQPTVPLVSRLLRLSASHVLRLSASHVLRLEASHVLRIEASHVLRIEASHVLRLEAIHVLRIEASHVLLRASACI
jgi:hypothetical protein